MATTDEFAVPRHPIGVVAERTRLTQDVLRVWERRYGVVEPGRSPNGQRLYSDADIERLRLLALATGMGRTISQIAALSTSELARMVRDDEAARSLVGEQARRAEPVSDAIEPALARALALDGPGLDALLRRVMLTIGLPAFLDTVATPLLIRIGDEWHAGRLVPSQEHLATAVIQRVVTATMQMAVVPPGAPNLVIATPAGERHEVGAVLAAAAAAAEGWRVTYLGADLPAGDIADAAIRTSAHAVGLSIIYVPDRARLVDEIRTIRTRLPGSVSLLIGGGGSASVSAELQRDGVRAFRDLAGLRNALRNDPAAAFV